VKEFRVAEFDRWISRLEDGLVVDGDFYSLGVVPFKARRLNSR